MPPHRVSEIVIAGGGIAGISAAYLLAVRAGVARVVVVDPRAPLSLTSSTGSEAYRNYWPGPGDTNRAKPRSPVQIRAAPPMFRCNFNEWFSNVLKSGRRSFRAIS